jgi:diaminohydroxyphosphoribosylaminopyrimidine deaminase / 5-amino-6-(5-phosphoribosylamino)uracil reductase
MTPETAADDARWMQEALRIAERGFTPPNPMVGCILVKNGVKIGEGFHPFAGQPHAERFALQEAGEAAHGATAYVTLEPCCHWGRTPPCTEALIAANVRKVVVAVADPDVRVSGKGIGMLRDAGIAVEVGIEEQAARELNAAFFHFHTTGMPLVTLKAAMTLDGKIATRTGDSKWITGSESRQYVHELRARSGAVMVGIGTLLADDAQLTSRLDPMPPRQPLRVIVDSHLRTPPNCAAVRIAQSEPEYAPLLIATTQAAPAENEAKLQCVGVEILRLPADENDHVSLPALLQHLAKRRIINLLVEGGGELNAALIQSNQAHRVLFFVAPKIIGGKDAPTPIEGFGVEGMAQAYRLSEIQIRRIGDDVAISGVLSTPNS